MKGIEAHPRRLPSPTDLTVLLDPSVGDADCRPYEDGLGVEPVCGHAWVVGRAVDLLVRAVVGVREVRLKGEMLTAGVAREAPAVEENLVDWTDPLHRVDPHATPLARVPSNRKDAAAADCRALCFW